MEDFKTKLDKYLNVNGIKGTIEEESATEDFKAGYYAKEELDIAHVRLSCFQEVWQKWCELDNSEFDKWLHDKMHDA